MSFELFEPPATAWIKPIEEGRAGLAKSGTLTLRPEDLALVQIEANVRVLVDTGTLRIAFRQTDTPARSVRGHRTPAESSSNESPQTAEAHAAAGQEVPE